MSATITAKICTRCQTERSLDGFSIDRSRPDGLQPWCKSCQSKSPPPRVLSEAWAKAQSVAHRGPHAYENVRSPEVTV